MPERPVSVGSKVAFTAQSLGRRRAYTYQVRGCFDTRFVMSTGEGAFPMETHLQVGRDVDRCNPHEAAQWRRTTRLFALDGPDDGNGHAARQP